MSALVAMDRWLWTLPPLSIAALLFGAFAARALFRPWLHDGGLWRL